MQTVDRPQTASDDGLTLNDVRDLLEGEFCWVSDPSLRVKEIGAADLMSDVLALSRPGMLLLTGLNNAQAVRTAAIADLAGIVFVRGKRPSEEVLALAREKGIPVMTTAFTMFEAAGRLYVGLRGG